MTRVGTRNSGNTIVKQNWRIGADVYHAGPIELSQHICNNLIFLLVYGIHEFQLNGRSSRPFVRSFVRSPSPALRRTRLPVGLLSLLHSLARSLIFSFVFSRSNIWRLLRAYKEKPFSQVIVMNQKRYRD